MCSYLPKILPAFTHCTFCTFVQNSVLTVHFGFVSIWEGILELLPCHVKLLIRHLWLDLGHLWLQLRHLFLHLRHLSLQIRHLCHQLRLSLPKYGGQTKGRSNPSAPDRPNQMFACYISCKNMILKNLFISFSLFWKLFNFTHANYYKHNL